MVLQFTFRAISVIWLIMYGFIRNSALFCFVLFEKREAFSYMLGLQQILYIVQPSSSCSLVCNWIF